MWFEAHRLFAYEVFLYIIAALIKKGAFDTLRQIFTSGYLEYETNPGFGTEHFVRFDVFCAWSQTLNPILAPPGKTLLSPAATLFKRPAMRADLPFESVMEAELLVFLMACVHGSRRWYPQTLFYLGYGKRFPFFIRAAQHKYFKRLATVSGIQSADEVRDKIKAGMELFRGDRWTDFSRYSDVSFWTAANIDKWDTID
jgi:hypothetical protein